MKSYQRLVIIVEGLLYLALAFLIQLIFPAVISEWGIALRIGYTLLIYYAFRRGNFAGSFAGLLLGAVSCIGLDNPADHIGQIIGMIIASGCLGIAGLFARNLQRTLHNRRMGSAYLNLVTGTILAWLAYFLVRFLTYEYLVSDLSLTTQVNFQQNALSALVNIALSLIILIVIMNVSAKNFIPKNTPYISRRERSRLLNDD